MSNKPAPSEIHHSLLTLIILLTLLTACAPTGTTTPEPAAVDTATAEFTKAVTVTITATATPTITTAPSLTPTATLSPEEAEQKITNALGVDLFNLADASRVTGEIAKVYPEVQKAMENNFPIEITGEVGGSFIALVTDFIVYTNYETAPRLFDNVVIIEVELSYLDANQQERQIYVPFYLYNEQTGMELTIGTAPQNESKDRLIKYMPLYDSDTRMDAWSNLFGLFLLMTEERGEKQIVLNEDNAGFFVDVDAIYPNTDYGQNFTSGWDFDLLNSDNPPYTEEDLANFQLTGDPNNLPEINGKIYFWPLTNISGSKFNILQDRVR